MQLHPSELLKSYGAKVEPYENSDESELETTSPAEDETIENGEPPSTVRSDPFGLEETKPKLITREGTSRYFDSALWSNLGDQLQHPEVGVLGEQSDESNIQESELFFEPGCSFKVDNLASFYPSFEILPKLREIYADRVDPMMKILHLPTFWTALMNGLRHPQDLSKSLEAAIFAFCCAAISALKEDECETLFGLQKSVMYTRYRVATRQALVNAGFLSTSSPMTLRAYAIFMLLSAAELIDKMCVRNSYRCDTLFVLSGVAIRLARKMGLHRDGTSLGLSPFETEMRRRLWWHLVHVDFRTADLLGTRASLDLSCGDTKMPLNVDDEDFNPDMVDLPSERNGITPISLCLIRCDIIETLRKFSTTHPGNVCWEVLYSPDTTLAKKDAVISQIEDHWENKYLRYCDPSNPLHTFGSIMIRSSVCKMKLFAHNPRQFANSPVKVPQSERDMVFANATKLLEYTALMQSDGQGLQKFTWQIGTSYLWNSILYVLIEARHRKSGSEVDKLWQLIGKVFSYYPQIFEESTAAVYAALGKWTLEVWDEYVAASKIEGFPISSTPEYINAIRRCRKPVTEPPSEANNRSADSEPVTRISNGYNKSQGQRDEEDLADFEPFDAYDFPDLLSFEVDPNEWVQWEQSVAGQNGFAQIDRLY
ncbi:MAG: hypothetical protein Q9157_001179 [Trypethelium eluteriae]